MEQETKRRQLYREIMILLIIMMIGTLLRLPISNFSGIDVKMLNDPDSYYYARKAVEYYNQPVSDWSLFSSRADDPLMTANHIDDTEPTPMLMPIIAALICKIFSFLSIDYVIYYGMTLFSVLAAIPVFLFVKSHSTSFGGFLGAALTVLSFSYFIHTKYGYFDTDGMILVIALSFMLSHIDFLLQTDKKQKITFAVLSIIFLVLFSLTWNMYFVYAAIALILLAVITVYKIIRKEKENYPIVAIYSVCVLLICFGISRKHIISMFLSIVSKPETVGWPLPGKFISELSVPSLISDSPNTGFIIANTGILNFSGGYAMFFALLISVALFFYAIVQKYKKRNEIGGYNFSLATALIVWLIISFLLTLKGIRYVQLLVLPSSIFVAYSFAVVIKEFGKKSLTGLKKDFLVIIIAALTFGGLILVNLYVAVAITLAITFVGLFERKVAIKYGVYMLLLSLFSALICNCYYVTITTKRYVDDDLCEVTEYLAYNSPENSMVVSWWDYGYYFEYAAQRQVAADGGTFSGEAFYWLANIFVTDNPQLSKGICNMLAGGSIDASELSGEYAGSADAGAQMLKDILVMNKYDAAACLKEKHGLNEDEIDKLISRSHPSETKPVYIVLSDKMMCDSSIIAYYGLWNFKDDIILSFDDDFDYKKDTSYYPAEIRDSIMLKLYFGDLPDGFSEVFSNETFKIFALDTKLAGE